MASTEDVKSGFSFARTPPPEASAYFRDKSLRPAFRWTEVWGQEHAYAFTVAKATQLDVLQAIKDSLQKAIDEGVPYEAWAKRLRPELEKRGWWGVKEMVDPATGKTRQVQLGSARRLETIYDANLRTARAAGQWERAQRTKAVLPFFVYQLGPSLHHRPEHEAREGFTAPVDSPIWNSWYPPNGWGCKCWLEQVTQAQADSRGGVSHLGALADDDAALPTRTYRRRRDDGSTQTVRVPIGIDPGWATNPGKARSATLMTALQEKLQAAGPTVAKASIAGLWASPTAEVLPKLPGRYFAPVAVAPPTVIAAIGATADVVMISSDTLAAKLSKHGVKGSRPLAAQDLGRVQALLDHGTLVQKEGAAASFILEMDGGWWKVAVKRAAGGREIIVRTLFPIDQRKAKALLERR